MGMSKLITFPQLIPQPFNYFNAIAIDYRFDVRVVVLFQKLHQRQRR